MIQTDVIELRAGDYQLALEPAQGGSVNRFDWRGKALFRSTCGPSILDAACFPLVPFSNRIAHGEFRWNDKLIKIAPNFPAGYQPHPLHGFGWLSNWAVIEHSTTTVVLRQIHPAGEWPWDYIAEQTFNLSLGGLRHELSVRNTSAMPMPVGLGFHPYFPRNQETLYRGLHHSEWQTSDEGLPISLCEAPHPIDWWDGEPVGSRIVDTVYSGRDLPLTIVWPDRELELTITPCERLSHTVVFTPADANFFCVEPVSHATNAINSADPANALREIGPGEILRADVRYRASEVLMPDKLD